MNVAELGRWIGDHYQATGDRLFRLERQPQYLVDDDGDDYRRWLEGATEPTWSRKNPWLETLRAEHAAGLVASRVRIFTEHLTDYERYACDFGYALNVPAGEDVRVLRFGEHAIPAELVEHDFWLAGDDHVARMYYDAHGHFEGAEHLDLAEAPRYVATRDIAWARSEPFLTWWARHPELHRHRAA